MFLVFRRFSVCIMDEASQCIEPEGLIPFCLGFNKLVMVGDPEQLPATVKSKKAKDNSLDTSMFSRYSLVANETHDCKKFTRLLMCPIMHLNGNLL